MPQIPRMNGMNKNEQFFQSSWNVPKPIDLGWYRSNNHIQSTKVAGTRSKGPKSLSQGWLQNPGYFGAKLGQKWSQAIVTVLDVPGPPNFAGTLVRSIPTQINRFWDISETLKKLFIFVHSVHSGNLGPHFGLPNVRSSSHCTYQSYSINKSRRNTF